MGEKKLDQYLTIAEAAQLLKMGTSTLRQKIKLGLLPTYKPALKILIKVTDLDAYVKRCKQ
jgi:excisionase family DNA binding protein